VDDEGRLGNPVGDGDAFDQMADFEDHDQSEIKN